MRCGGSQPEFCLLTLVSLHDYRNDFDIQHCSLRLISIHSAFTLPCAAYVLSHDTWMSVLIAGLTCLGVTLSLFEKLSVPAPHTLICCTTSLVNHPLHAYKKSLYNKCCTFYEDDFLLSYVSLTFLSTITAAQPAYSEFEKYNLNSSIEAIISSIASLQSSIFSQKIIL